MYNNGVDLKESKTIPGPGTYPIIQSISPKGNQFLSKYNSSKASVFHPPNSVRFKEICLFNESDLSQKISRARYLLS